MYRIFVNYELVMTVEEMTEVETVLFESSDTINGFLQVVYVDDETGAQEVVLD